MQLQFHLLLLLLIPFKYKCSKGRETLYIHSLLLVVEHWGIRTIAHSQNFSEDLRINLTKRPLLSINSEICTNPVANFVAGFSEVEMQRCRGGVRSYMDIYIYFYNCTCSCSSIYFSYFCWYLWSKREREGSGLIWPLYLGAHWHLTPRSSPQRFTF